jgi:predicted transcriptional regulator
MEDIKRDIIVVYAQILSVAKDGASKREIHNKAMINYDRMNERLDELKRFNLLEQSGRNYKTNEKGFLYLSRYNRVIELVQPELKIPEVD